MKLSASLTALSLTLFAFGGAFIACDSEEESSDGGINKGGAGGASSSTSAFCEADNDCEGATPRCDTALQRCVECTTATDTADCSDTSICQAGVCEEQTLCSSSKQCADDQVCDTGKQYCVGCLGDVDCAAGSSCQANSCQVNCTADKDCRASGGVCDEVASACFECQAASDCAAGNYCNALNSCVSVICESDESFCNGDSSVSCNEEGSGYDQTSCAQGCADGACIGEVAGAGDGDGDADQSGDGNTDQPGDGEGEGEGDKPVVCEGVTADYCDLMPAFTGTQVVDGKDDEFCNVPAMELTYADAGYQNMKNMSASTTGSKVTVRAGWDASGLHLHAHIVDSKLDLSAADWYNDDNFQLFVGPSAPSNGDLVTDKGIQIGITPAVGDTAEFRTETGATTDVSIQSFTRVVDDGYEVELSVGWPGGTAPSSGDKMAFNFLVGARNERESWETLFDFEYGPYIGTAGCGSAPAEQPYCSTLNWCSPKAE